MKKIIGAILILVGLLAYSPVKADSTVYGFQDGKFYNVNQQLVYFCFQDGSCYDMNQNPVLITVYHPAAPVIQAPIDVCPNIEGVQSVTPIGMSLVNGNCVVPNIGFTPNPDPIVINPVITASCAVTAIDNPNQNSNFSTTISWTTQGLTDPIAGILYGVEGQSAGNYIYAIYGHLNGANGTITGIYHSSFGVPYKAIFGDTICYGTPSTIN